MSTNLAALSQAGVSIWLDDLSRDRINSGNLAELIRDKHVVGVTTNPTIFAGALSDGEAYDEQVRQLAARGADVHATVRELTTTDVRNAADVFRDVYTSTGGLDGRVSIEVDPGLARDTDKTVAEAADLWKTVDRPNVLVKIPATEEGLPAITKTLAQGISVNVTLIFSVERYRAVIDAYFAGLEQAKANGHDLSAIQSVASFFVSRVDSEIDKRLEAIGTDEALGLRGEAAIANARLAYAAYEELFSSERWQALKADGANPQRPLWASTGVKNPDYSDTRYVDGLVVAGTVNTMPEATLEASADHANVTGDTVSGTAEQAQAVFDKLAAAGIDITDVFITLENEGVEKFDKSWGELLDTVSGQLEKAKG
ncbi:MULTISPECIES: transaldolase [Prauserella salsuginis group]|uniref:Transaldolase n=2 Tax=Prauserella salsuginis group TaxID=2893672 RepID=A0A839XUU0_9PSEU|nr:MULTISPECIES: transaldolase [Prauserella salsuginis group]MBB3665809.1 transaldolase [Prauserella sediminis]MCR3722990.1 transaldolase [Prauserella flava]MCR3737334.1 transaldolase [Prauserella salsuginis]